MGEKRIIPCLVVSEGRVLRGINESGAEDAGDPLERARLCSEAGADELMLFDISTSDEGRETLRGLVRRVAQQLSIPLIVGGGISTLQEMGRMRDLGAEKIAINTAAITQPDLIAEGAARFGSEAIVVSVSAKRYKDQRGWQPFVEGRQEATGLDAVSWAKEAERHGAGELLVTSIEGSNNHQGYDLGLTRAVVDAVSIPIIAAGGASCVEDFADAFTFGGADAALAIALFHDNPLSIGSIKHYLREREIWVRGS